MLNKRVLLALWGMARPLIMLSVLLVYALGVLIARSRGYDVSGEAVVWGCAALVLVSLSIHYANEYADFATDSLTQKTAFSGGSGVLPGGGVSPRLALAAAWVTLVAGIAVAVAAVVIGVLDVLILPILVIGAFGGWMYSVPPLRLAYCGMGEVTNAVLGGLLLPLYGYVVVSGEWSFAVLLACVPFALVDFLNLLATTWADVEADTQVGKYTLATRIHPALLRLMYGVVAGVVVGLIVFLPRTILPQNVALGSLVVVPLLLWGWLRYTRTESPTPSVLAMVGMGLAQTGAYLTI